MTMKLFYKTLFAVLIASAAIFMSSCDDTVSAEDIDNRTIPESDVSFTTDLLPVFNLKCSSGQCHNSSYMAGGYSMETWSNVVQAGIVNPGSPETSRLIWRIDAKYGYELMPPVGEPINPITESQLNGIYTWIEEGALNN